MRVFASFSLKGVPLAYDNIRIVGQHGDIYDDSGYIHMDIMANFIVFQPKKGQKLLVRFTAAALGRFWYSEVPSSWFLMLSDVSNFCRQDMCCASYSEESIFIFRIKLNVHLKIPI